MRSEPPTLAGLCALGNAPDAIFTDAHIHNLEFTDKRIAARSLGETQASFRFGLPVTDRGVGNGRELRCFISKINGLSHL
jgi:hypothetical protein